MTDTATEKPLTAQVSDLRVQVAVLVNEIGWLRKIGWGILALGGMNFIMQAFGAGK